MNFVDGVRNVAAFLLVQSLVHCLWEGIILVAIAAIVAIAIRRRSSQAKYVLWFAVLGMMVVCVPANLFVLSGQRPTAVSNHVPANGHSADEEPVFDGHAMVIVESPFVLSEEDPRGVVASVEIPVLPETLPAEPVSRLPRQDDRFSGNDAVREISKSAAVSPSSGLWAQITPYATSVYAAGVILMFLRLFSALYGGRRLRAVAQAITEDPIAGFVQRHERRLTKRFAPIIAYCERITVPVVVGVMKPAILLPATIATQLTPEQLEAVLLHELAHIRRYDHLFLLLQRSIEAVLFFHPAVWLVSRIVSRERENCCDDFVLRHGSKPDCYAESLVRLSELRHGASSGSQEPVGALAVAEKGRSQLRRRVMRILGETQGVLNVRLTIRGLIAFSALLIACLLPFGLLSRTQGGPPGNSKPEETPVTNDDADRQADSESSELYVPIEPLGDNDVRGVVLDENRNPLSGITVAAGRWQRPFDNGVGLTDRHESTTDAAGRFLIKGLPGEHTWCFLIEAGRYPWHQQMMRVAAVPGQKQYRNMTFVLYEPRTLSGSVVDEQGQPVASARVTADVLRPTFNDLERDRLSVTTDATGRFAFPKLLPGSANFLLEHPNCSRTVVTTDVPASGTRLVIKKGLRLEGRVVHDGKPLAGVTVKGWSICPDWHRLDAWEVVTDDEGRFKKHRIPDFGPEKDTIYVSVAAEEFTSDRYRVFTNGGGTLPVFELRARRKDSTTKGKTVDLGKPPHLIQTDSPFPEFVPKPDETGRMGEALTIRLEPEPDDAENWQIHVGNSDLIERDSDGKSDALHQAWAVRGDSAWSASGVPPGPIRVQAYPPRGSKVYYVPEIVTVRERVENQEVTLRPGSATVSGTVRGLELPAESCGLRCTSLDRAKTRASCPISCAFTGIAYPMSGIAP